MCTHLRLTNREANISLDVFQLILYGTLAATMAENCRTQIQRFQGEATVGKELCLHTKCKTAEVSTSRTSSCIPLQSLYKLR